MVFAQLCIPSLEGVCCVHIVSDTVDMSATAPLDDMTVTSDSVVATDDGDPDCILSVVTTGVVSVPSSLSASISSV